MRKIPKDSTPIIHKIIEGLAIIRLSTYEFNVVHAIIRKTYGWDKPDDWISLSQLQELTNIPARHCSRTLQKLFSKKIIIREGKNIGINKHTEAWAGTPQTGSTPSRVLPKQGAGTPQTGMQVLPKQGDTKETITKETIQKKVTKVTEQAQGEKKDLRKKEINEMLLALKNKIEISAFVDSRIERKIAKHCCGLMGKIGVKEFVRRLDLILQDDFHHKNCNKILYVYNQIKGFIEPKKDSGRLFKL